MKKQTIYFRVYCYIIGIILFILPLISADITITTDSVGIYTPDASPPYLYCDSNWCNSSTNSIVFICTATTISPATIDNISLWNNVTGIWELNETITGLTLESETAYFYKNVSEGTYEWTCNACDNNSICDFANENRTLTIDTTFPTIQIISPTALLNYGYIGMIEVLSWIVSDIHLSSISYNYNGEYSCGRGRGGLGDCDGSYIYTYLYGATNSTTFIVNNTSLSIGNNTPPFYINFYSSDYAGNTNSSYILFDYKIFNNGETYNSITKENSIETFIINVTANSSLTNAYLIYDGINYIGTQSENLWSRTITIIGTGDKTFYWNFTYAGNQIYSDPHIQTVNSRFGETQAVYDIMNNVGSGLGKFMINFSQGAFVFLVIIGLIAVFVIIGYAVAKTIIEQVKNSKR
jgi:hypothetical protein